MTSIKISTANDLIIENNDLSLVVGRDEIAQVLRQKLRLFLGEWFLDTREGLDYYGVVLKKNVDPGKLDALFKEAILSSRGVVELINFKLELSQRTLSLEFVARTSDGIINFSEDLI
jgi:hypothetical protein